MDEIVAKHVEHEIALSAARPAAEWQHAVPISFCADWQGLNPDPALLTQVRALWSTQTLFLRFESRYREVHVFEDADLNGRRDHLWERDVVEAFLQPDATRERYYKEFEVSPNGMWLDLDIFPGGRADLNSGMGRSVFINETRLQWAAELAIPIAPLGLNGGPGAIWRANFYRVEGRQEPRHYLAWHPTYTPEPNFHVPSAFGAFRFG
jgi:hypothetical protein